MALVVKNENSSIRTKYSSDLVVGFKEKSKEVVLALGNLGYQLRGIDRSMHVGTCKLGDTKSRALRRLIYENPLVCRLHLLTEDETQDLLYQISNMLPPTESSFLNKWLMVGTRSAPLQFHSIAKIRARYGLSGKNKSDLQGWEDSGLSDLNSKMKQLIPRFAVSFRTASAADAFLELPYEIPEPYFQIAGFNDITFIRRPSAVCADIANLILYDVLPDKKQRRANGVGKSSAYKEIFDICYKHTVKFSECVQGGGTSYSGRIHDEDVENLRRLSITKQVKP